MQQQQLIMQKNTLSVDEVEFFAEETKIWITPSFKLANPLMFISGSYGPFTPSVPAEVPLWLAIQLKKANRCRINAPKWMRLESLQELYRREQEDERLFMPIPEHYLEIASLLLQFAEKDIANAARIRSMLADIESVRMNKIRAGLEQIHSGAVLKLNNISSMELTTIQPFCVAALNVFRKLGEEDQLNAQDGMDAQVVHEVAPPSLDTSNNATSARGMRLQARTNELQGMDPNLDDEVGDNEPVRKLRRYR